MWSVPKSIPTPNLPPEHIDGGRTTAIATVGGVASSRQLDGGKTRRKKEIEEEEDWKG